MGLLEKASNIQTEEEPKTVVLKTPKPVSEPDPIKEPKKTSKKERKARRTKRKKAKAPREQRTLPDGFELATTGQRITRRVCDFAVSYGWSVPMLAIMAWGSDFDSTYIIMLGLALIIFNLYFMPRYAGNRSVGNWISHHTWQRHDAGCRQRVDDWHKACTKRAAGDRTHCFPL